MKSGELYEIKYSSPLDNQLLSTMISKEDTLNICEMKGYIRRKKIIAMEVSYTKTHLYVYINT